MRPSADTAPASIAVVYQDGHEPLCARLLPTSNQSEFGVPGREPSGCCCSLRLLFDCRSRLDAGGLTRTASGRSRTRRSGVQPLIQRALTVVGCAFFLRCRSCARFRSDASIAFFTARAPRPFPWRPI